MNNGLFLPLEVVKREYLGRLCLAVEMAARGMPVFIGHKKWIIRLALDAEPGIFFYKDAARDEWFVPGLRDRGFALVAQDEEAGIIYADYAEFFSRRKSLENVPNLDLFFAWGDDDYDFLARRMCTAEKCNLVKSGAVKTILWGAPGRQYFAEDIDRIRGRYGRFVIFITNFAVGNSYLPLDELLGLAEKNDGAASEQYRERYEKESRLMRFVMRTSRAIVERTGLNVVIRPHPTENVDNWRRQVANLDKVFVEPEGDLSPWILASDGVLHNSCTSGIQAAASNVPVVAFGELGADLEGACSVPNAVSEPVLGLDELLDAVVEMEDGWCRNDEARLGVLRRKIAGAGSLRPLTDTADALVRLAGTPNKGGNARLGGDSVLYDVRELYRTSGLRAQTRRRILDRNKRPPIHKRDIRRDVGRIAAMLGHGRDVDIRRVEMNSFCIRAK